MFGSDGFSKVFVIHVHPTAKAFPSHHRINPNAIVFAIDVSVGAESTIMNEIERQTMLGVLSPGGSILEKYHTVGNQLYGQTQQQNTRRPIDTRTASRSSANNSNRAKAAGSPRAGNRTSMVMEDLARLDDDAFLAAMKARL